MNELVEVDFRASVATLTVSRPDALNALNAPLLEQMRSHLIELTDDPRVRVIVLTGAGERAFIAGADINEFVGIDPAGARQIAARIKSVTDLMVACPKPIVASIHGFCLGGGLELALACDIRIASTSARFGLPEIKLGILPGGAGTVRLTKAVGASMARSLAMTGDMITAERAFGVGLLAELHAPADLPEATRKLSHKLAALGPFALAQIKSVLQIAMNADVETACAAEIDAFALCFTTEDAAEGARAFLEKRPPHFTGR